MEFGLDGVKASESALLSLAEGSNLQTLEPSIVLDSSWDAYHKKIGLTFSDWRYPFGWQFRNNVMNAAKIYYALALNRYGRQELLNKPECSPGDLVNLLTKAEADTRRRIKKEKTMLVNNLTDKCSPEWHLHSGGLFNMLRTDPNVWSHDPAGYTDLLDTASANYGLLREIPGLWCHTEERRRMKPKHRKLS